jgi:hypothetical protein
MGNILLLGDPPVPQTACLTDRLQARLRGAALDAALAGGCPPESSRLLAARAALLVAPGKRRAVAASWEHLVRVARRLEPSPRAAVPVRADQVIAAEPAIDELVRLLRAGLPVPARGVAMARLPLTDPTSPVYARRAPGALTEAVRAAADQLDPFLPLMQQERAARPGPCA